MTLKDILGAGLIVGLFMAGATWVRWYRTQPPTITSPSDTVYVTVTDTVYAPPEAWLSAFTLECRWKERP